ncbi:MAG: hypothetical protein ACK56F_32535, partial [bacterium]
MKGEWPHGGEILIYSRGRCRDHKYRQKAGPAGQKSVFIITFYSISQDGPAQDPKLNLVFKPGK